MHKELYILTGPPLSGRHVIADRLAEGELTEPAPLDGPGPTIELAIADYEDVPALRDTRPDSRTLFALPDRIIWFAAHEELSRDTQQDVAARAIHSYEWALSQPPGEITWLDNPDASRRRSPAVDRLTEPGARPGIIAARKIIDIAFGRYTFSPEDHEAGRVAAQRWAQDIQTLSGGAHSDLGVEINRSGIGVRSLAWRPR